MVNKNKLGLVIGSFLGLWHLVWAALVARGVGQWVLDWVFKLHYIHPPYTVTAFRWDFALGLILTTSLLGYLSGWMVAAIWNWVQEVTQDGDR